MFSFSLGVLFILCSVLAFLFLRMISDLRDRVEVLETQLSYFSKSLADDDLSAFPPVDSDIKE